MNQPPVLWKYGYPFWSLTHLQFSTLTTFEQIRWSCSLNKGGVEISYVYIICLSYVSAHPHLMARCLGNSGWFAEAAILGAQSSCRSSYIEIMQLLSFCNTFNIFLSEHCIQKNLFEEKNICLKSTQFCASVCVITISGTEQQFPQWKVWSLHLFGRRGFFWVDGYHPSNTSIVNCSSKQAQNIQSNMV